MQRSFWAAVFSCAWSVAACSSDKSPWITRNAGAPAIMESGGAGSAGVSGIVAPPVLGTAGQRAAPAAASGGSVAVTAGAGGGSVAGTPAAGGGGTTAMPGTVAGGGVTGTGGSIGAGGSSGASASSDCDRACLLQVVQSYLDAVVAHDPSRLKLSSALKMTDNGSIAKPGDGLWKSASALVSGARLDFADPVTKNVGTQCVINEGSTPVMYEVRLKVDAGEITEIETLTVRQADAANGFFDPSNVKPQPVFSQLPDSSKRMTRAELMSLQEQYLDYLEGKRSGSEVPFDGSCARYENGVSTASGTASFEFQSWGFMVTRRVLIIDEEASITFGMFPFMQDAEALVVGEAFKMLNGKIMMIQAVMAYMPAKAWD